MEEIIIENTVSFEEIPPEWRTKKNKKRKNKERIILTIRQRRQQKRKNRKKIAKQKLKNNGEKIPPRSFIKFIESSKFSKNKISKEALTHNFNTDSDVIVIPSVFSLILNPDEAIEVYNKIFRACSIKKSKGIYFDHSKCLDLEIGASAVMDVFVLNMKNYQEKIFKRELPFGGELPTDNYQKEKLYVSGILKHLKVDEKTTRLIHHYKENLKTLDLIKGGLNTTTILVHKSNDSGNTSTRVIAYFDKCLRTQGYSLSLKGKNYFGHLIGEAVNNCQLHSGDFCQWFVLGHYDVQGNNDYGEFNLVLFNFGKSIFESLKETRLSPEISASLDHLTKIHEKGFNEEWDEETLWTLYALQDGVSRLKSTEQKDRGVGTVKLIRHFQKIGCTSDGKTPVMSIISGNSYILFNKDDDLKDEMVNGSLLGRIAFNVENDLEIRPNPNNVMKLKNNFPGTIVSIRFYIENEFFGKVIEEEELNHERGD